MTTNYTKTNEPLFVVILRGARANELLRAWTTANATTHAQLQENRLHLFDHHGLSTFMVTWQSPWDNVVIWDCWNKRHIDIQNS